MPVSVPQISKTVILYACDNNILSQFLLFCHITNCSQYNHKLCTVKLYKEQSELLKRVDTEFEISMFMLSSVPCNTVLIIVLCLC